MSSKRKIRVNNFDSYLQANLWRGMGANEAILNLNAALRLALFLGDELLLDRNEILDGIYFLSLGPDGIAQILGLDPWEKLPITWIWEPGDKDTQNLDDKIPPLNLYGENLDKIERVSVEKQLSSINKSEFWTYSSSLSAIWKDCEKRKNAKTEWLYVNPCKQWYPGIGLRDFFHPINSELEAKELINKARQKWIEYAKTDKISVKAWNKINQDIMQTAFEKHSKELQEIIGKDNLDPLAIEILNLSKIRTRKEIPSEIANIDDEKIQTNNTLLTRQRRNRLSFQLYSRLYNYANARINDAMFLTLSIPNPELHGANDEKNLISFGLRLPKQKVKSKFEEWMIRKISPSDSKALWRVDGELIDDMKKIHSSTFNSLRHNHHEEISKQLSDGNRIALFTLSVAVRESLALTSNYWQKVRSTMTKVIFFTTLMFFVAVLSFIKDAFKLSPESSLIIVIVVTILSFISSLPWSEISTMLGLKPGKMNATLSLD